MTKKHTICQIHMTDCIVVHTDNKKMEESHREENIAGKKKIEKKIKFA